MAHACSWWRSTVLLAALQVACAPVVTAADRQETPVIVLQHIGPEDASLPQIELRSAASEATTEARSPKPRVVRVLVAPNTLAGFCRDLTALSPALATPERTGTFDAQARHCLSERTDEVVSRRIGPETFLRWIGALQRDTTVANPLPDGLDRVAQIIRSANGLGTGRRPAGV